MGMNLDRISDLPEDVVDRILSLVPIKDAVRASVLSTKWRYKWETVSTLVFDDRSLPIVCWYGITETYKLVKDIYRVLVLHSGPIHKFVLSYAHLRNIPSYEIDKWIRYLSRHSLSEFVLGIPNSKHHKMPSCVFSFEHLTRFVLINCWLAPLSTFKGFKHLTSLELTRVVVAQDVLERLVSSSPVLQRLTMSHVAGLKQVNIESQSLEFFDIHGDYFVDTSLKCTNLGDFSMYFSYKDGNTTRGDLVKLMAEIPQVGRLTIGNNSLVYLAGRDIPRELPVPCSNLYYLRIGIAFTSFDEILALLCLLSSVPNLQELHIECHLDWVPERSAEVREAGRWNCLFTRLRCVNISNFSGFKPQMNLIKIMLLTAPVLEKIVVKLFDEIKMDNEKAFGIVRQVCCFKCASPLVEIDI